MGILGQMRQGQLGFGHTVARSALFCFVLVGACVVDGNDIEDVETDAASSTSLGTTGGSTDGGGDPEGTGISEPGEGTEGVSPETGEDGSIESSGSGEVESSSGEGDSTGSSGSDDDCLGAAIEGDFIAMFDESLEPIIGVDEVSGDVQLSNLEQISSLSALRCLERGRWRNFNLKQSEPEFVGGAGEP